MPAWTRPDYFRGSLHTRGPTPRGPRNTPRGSGRIATKGKRGRGPSGVGVPLARALGALSIAQPPGFGAALPGPRGRGHRGGRVGPGGCRLPLWRRGLHRCPAPREPSPGGGACPASSCLAPLVHRQHTEGFVCQRVALGLELFKTLLFLEVGCEHQLGTADRQSRRVEAEKGMAWLSVPPFAEETV